MKNLEVLISEHCLDLLKSIKISKLSDTSSSEFKDLYCILYRFYFSYVEALATLSAIDFVRYNQIRIAFEKGLEKLGGEN